MASLKQARQPPFCYCIDFGSFFLDTPVLIKNSSTHSLLILLCFLVPCIANLLGCILAAEKGNDVPPHVLAKSRMNRSCWHQCYNRTSGGSHCSATQLSGHSLGNKQTVKCYQVCISVSPQLFPPLSAFPPLPILLLSLSAGLNPRRIRVILKFLIFTYNCITSLLKGMW